MKPLKILTKQNLLRAGILILAALAMAAGLEMLMQRLMPPVFMDMEVDINADPTLISRGSTYLHPSGREALREEWNALRLAGTFLIQLTILIVVFPLGWGRRTLKACREQLLRLRKVFTEEKKRNLKLLCCFAGTAALVFFLSRIWILDDYRKPDNWMIDTLCLTAGLCAGCLAAFPRTLAKKPEVFFLILTLAIGGLLAFLLPDATTVSMDDGHHFQHALNYSTLGHVRFTGQDWDAMQADNVKNYQLGEEREAWLRAQDEKHARGAVYVTSSFHLDPKEYWTGTYGLGLFLGRLFHLNYWNTWSLGRFTGLLAYALLGFFAIRRLKNGKMIVAAALMMPEAVFFAANYSYDPSVTIGMALSFCYWLAQWQERDQKLKNSDVAMMMVPLFFACITKAVYFPLYVLFLFLPKTKFRDRKHRRQYNWTVLLSTAAVIAYILLPFSSSGGQGDNRAAGDINTFGQLQYILTHPLQYAATLWHFLQSYLNLNDFSDPVSRFAYMGGTPNTVIYLLLMTAAVFTDHGEEDLQPKAWVRGAGMVIVFGTLILVVTSMYLYYTAVGSDGVAGCQPRYLLPLICPAMALTGSGKIQNRMNPALYHGLLFAGIAFVGFSAVMAGCISYYG